MADMGSTGLDVEGKCPECDEIISYLTRRTEIVDFEEWWVDKMGSEQTGGDPWRENDEYITYTCPECGSEIEDPYEVFNQDVKENKPGEALPE